MPKMDIKSLLTPHETIQRDARIHWIVFGPLVFYTFIGALAGTFFHPLIGGLILFMCLYPLYTSIISYKMTHLVLTNKKVMARVGFITRDWTQMTFERIENAYLEEPIIGRIFGYSTVVVSGVGKGTIAVPRVVRGDEFVKELQKYLDKNAEQQG